MKLKSFLIAILSIVYLSSCGIQEQRDKLDRDAAALKAKEQELMLKEKDLELREQALNDRQKRMDSVMTLPDTLLTMYPFMPGTWNVKMVCTEASCAGSALGDTKVEQWAIGFNNNQVVVKALNNKQQLTRIYTGSVEADGSINLTAQPIKANDSEITTSNITVQLKIEKNKVISGQRVIVQPDNCRIVYSLDLKKLN